MILKDYLVRGDKVGGGASIEALIKELMRMGCNITLDSSYEEVLGVLVGVIGYEFEVIVKDSTNYIISATVEVVGTDAVTIN